MWRIGAALFMLGALSGCRVCQSDYDYCGPVVYPGYGPALGFHDREGSILQGNGSYGPAEMYESETIEPQISPVPGAVMRQRTVHYR